MEKEMIGIGKASRILGVNEMTIRRWEERGLLPVIRTPKGHRRYRVEDLQKFIESRENENDQLNMEDKEADEIRSMIALFCRGLIEFQQIINDGKFLAYPQLWIESSCKLRDFSLKRNGVDFPTSLPEQIKYWETPLEEWGIPGFQKIFGPDSDWCEEPYLFENFKLTEYCYDKAAQGRDPKKELDLKTFEEIMEECRLEKDQKNYVAARCFPLDFPIVDIFNDWHLKIIIVAPKYRNNIKKMYEPIPEEYSYEGYIHLCPYCGWTLKRDRHGVFECDTPKCRNAANKAGIKWEPKTLLWTHNLMRIRRGIREYIVLPGIPEMRMFNRLQALPHVKVELYPECDAFGDIILQFADEKWLVDIKDWNDPRALAQELNENHPFERSKRGEDWDMAFIVPPLHMDHRYIRILENETKNVKGVTIMGERNFHQMIRRKMEDYT